MPNVKPLLTFRHTSIGKLSHAAKASVDAMSYIMRHDALTHFQAEHMPEGGRGTRGFFEEMAEGRPNARVCDKLILALPLEMSREQRHEAVASFMQDMGKGKIAWCAAHHDAGKDAENPHAHVMFLDRDMTQEKGGKVIGTTTSARDVREAQERGWKEPPRMSTVDMRGAWCDHLNGCMEKAGLDIRYDHRSYKDRGIDQQPQIHVGPEAQAMREKGVEPGSRERLARNGRIVDYPHIDQGRRAEHNAEIIASNRADRSADAHIDAAMALEMKKGRKPTEQEASEKQAVQSAQQAERQTMREQQAEDREALRELHLAQAAEHKAWGQKLYREARERAFQSVSAQTGEKWKAVRAIKDRAERKEAVADMKLFQKQLYDKEAKGQVEAARPEKDKAFQALKKQQEQDRKALQKQHLDERAMASRQHLAERYGQHESFRAGEMAQAMHRLGLQVRSGMAGSQAQAHAMMLLRQRFQAASAPPGFKDMPKDPQQAAAAYMARAHEEHGARAAFREKLLRERDGRRAETQSITMKAAGHSREAGGADRQRTQAGASMRALRGVREQDTPQKRAQQAEQSRRPLTSDEKANASPELKAKISQQERKAAARDRFTAASPRQQPRGKDRGGGRGGGGRGR